METGNIVTKCLMSCLLITGLFANVNAQTSTIKGTIKTSDGQPAEFVNVGLKGTTKGTSSDSKGNYELTKIEAGIYTLVMSFIGLETKEQQIEVKESETLLVPEIQLNENAKILNEVVVRGNRNKFSQRESEYIARMPIKNLENPQVYNVVTKELMKEQIVTNFNDAVKNTPGLDKLWSSTGRGNDGAAYFTLRGFSVQPTMVNGITGSTNGGLDPANIERIEVIKGPSGTLFGSSAISFGGLINIVTKKPYETFGGEISYTAGSFGLNRISADVNTPINGNKDLLLRVNSAYHYENSFQDAGFTKTFFLAPSLSYKASEKLSFLVNTEFYNSESTNPLMLFLNRSRKLVATNPDELNIPYNRSFTSNDVTISTPTFNVFGQANYKISDKWTSQTSFSTSNRKSLGYYQYVMFIAPGDSLLNRYVSDQNSTGITANIQQNFIGDFKIAGMRNRLVAGVDFFTSRLDNNNSAYIVFDTIVTTRNDVRYTQLTRSALDVRFSKNLNPVKNTSTSNTYSAYASDLLNITDNLMAMMSLRIDRFENKGTYNLRTDATTGDFSQTALSPKFGLVYQLIKNRLSVFGNYMNGFRNVAAATQPDGTVSNFKPQQANQAEGGIKMELFNGKLAGTLSYYDIKVSNVVRPHPEQAGFTVQDGNIFSRGFEADIIASPLPGLNIIAGYSYNESENDKTDATIIGRRPTSAGPQNLANAWISYNLVKGSLKGLGIGFGGNYASENIITNNSLTGEFILPAYTVINGTVFYNAQTFRLGLKVDNITDKQYYKGWSTVEPQMPRRLSANVTFKF